MVIAEKMSLKYRGLDYKPLSQELRGREIPPTDGPRQGGEAACANFRSRTLEGTPVTVKAGIWQRATSNLCVGDKGKMTSGE